MISQRIQLAREAESQTIFVVPFGGAFLKVYAWQTEDGDYDDTNIIQVDLFADKACTKLIAEEIDWANIEDLSGIFLEIRTQQFARDDRKRRREEALRDCPPAIKAEIDRDLANALRLAPVFDSIFGRIGR